MRLFNDYSYYHFILWKRDGPLLHYHMMILNLESLKEEYDYLLCLKFDYPQALLNADINEIVRGLQAIFYDQPDTFVVLTLRKEAPLYQVSNDEFVYSFSCGFLHFRSMLLKIAPARLLGKNLLFEILNSLGNGGSRFNRIIVRQIPFGLSDHVVTHVCDVVIPHRGNVLHLHTLTRFLNRLKNLNVFIGIDQPVLGEDFIFGQNYKDVSFYSFKPNPVGPYVIRNWLINEGEAEFVFFQDSDDIPCADRFERLSAFMYENEIPLCGSHEIRLDYFKRTVQAVRYPLNVSAALQNGPVHALLHPSSAILRKEFFACNRLSDNRIFANDTKFLYYCYFKLAKISNIDEFLYIRRLRPGSLTTSPDTCIGSLERTYLINRWVLDFTLVKGNLLKLEDSCLNYEGTRRKIAVVKLC